MPELITLRLHSQNGGGLKAIRYNAFNDINAKLENLYVYHVAVLFNVYWSDNTRYAKCFDSECRLIFLFGVISRYLEMFIDKSCQISLLCSLYITGGSVITV